MRRFLVVAAALVALATGAAAPAYAHDGPIALEVAGDGATGVTARATYEDGHAVDGVALVLTATADRGRKVGPVQLLPAAEGRGFYTSGAVLTPGVTWQVTVAAPSGRKASATVAARAAQVAPPVPVAAPRRPPPSGSYGWVWVLGAVVVVVAALAVVAVRVRRS